MPIVMLPSVEPSKAVVVPYSPSCQKLRSSAGCHHCSVSIAQKALCGFSLPTYHPQLATKANNVFPSGSSVIPYCCKIFSAFVCITMSRSFISHVCPSCLSLFSLPPCQRSRGKHLRMSYVSAAVLYLLTEA